MKIKVLSLFDGISCGQVALEQLGIEVETYYASEICKDAIKITQNNYPNTIQVGDVNNIDFNQYKDVDLIMAGSPCQGFSFQGKQLAFNDERSKLFFKFIEAVETIKPKYFLLENVKMKKEYIDIIDNLLGVKGVYISSKHFSAQDRKRYYWTNLPFDKKFPNSDLITPITIVEQTQHNWLPQETIDKLLGQVWQTTKRNIKMADLYMNTKMPTLLKSGKASAPFFYENGKWRYPTPIELERLQTLPDNYTAGQSYNKRYSHIGNGWNVETIKWILKNIK
jgi:site-specific DNA-cytosine methylase